MKIYIITGASRGLGAALTEALIDPEHRLICMARSKAPLDALRKRAKASNCDLTPLSVDLSDARKATTALTKALADIDPTTCTSVCLINNAGVVEPVCMADKLLPRDIAVGIHVNVVAPMALTALFLKLTADWQAERMVLNISSGAAHRPYAGWSFYCASKAALDQFTRCVALEQQGLTNGARIASVAPGVIDTAMQEAIRGKTTEEFRELPRFVALKESGQLASPADVAQRLLRYLARADFGATPVDDVRSS